MIEELKSKNESMKSNIQTKLFGDQLTEEGYEGEIVQEKVNTLGDEKKKLERELRAVENRIKHILAEHEEIESEMAGYESKAKRILEARSKKLEWEKQKEQELKLAEQMAKEKREELAKKAIERDQLINQRREIHTRQQEKVHSDIKEEKKVAGSLREKILEYEKVLKEHKKLQSLSFVHPSKVDQLHRIKNEKKQKKDYLMSKAKLETQAVSDLDKKLEKLKQLEQRMLEEKKISLTQKGIMKSHLQDIMNKKIQENEISELLSSKDRQLKSPGGIKRKSLTRILQGDELDKAPRTKSPGLPTKFVGGNIGSYTEMRKQTWEQREKGGASPTDGSANHTQRNQKVDKPIHPTRFASPQTRLTQPRPTTAAHMTRVSGIVSPKGQKPTTILGAGSTKVSPQPKLTKPAVSKPSQVTAARIVTTNLNPKKEEKKNLLSSTAQKTIMRGRGTKKDIPEVAPAEVKPQASELDHPHDSEVVIESSRNDEKDRFAESHLSETQFGASTMELSRQPEDSIGDNHLEGDRRHRIT